MRHVLTRALAILLVLPSALAGQVDERDPTPFVGTWEGKIEMGNMVLRVVFHVSVGEDGRPAATMDSPDQGAHGLPVTRVIIDSELIRFEMRDFAASYEALLVDEGTVLDGTFSQGGADLPLRLAHVAAPSKLSRPQTPTPPFPYGSIEVTYRNPVADIELAGTLTVPTGDGPFPAALLITGSGAQDRDETIFEHKPFLVIADHLTRHGIAVLRVDDRGVGGSGGSMANATSLDFATDVRAGIAFLRTRPEIDDARIGLIGHSEGGLIAPIVAAADEAIAFIVLLAGPGVPGDELLELQAELLIRTSGAPDVMIATNRERQRALFALMKDESLDRDALAEKVRAILAEDLTIPPATMDAHVQQSTSPWMRFFVSFDPRPTLARVRCPILALNGGLDLQVDAKQNLTSIAATLREADHPDHTAIELAQLNHLLQPARTGLITEYASIEQTMAEEALDAMTEWITERVRAKSAPAEPAATRPAN